MEEMKENKKFDALEWIALGFCILLGIVCMVGFAKVIIDSNQYNPESCGNVFKGMSLKSECYELTRFYSTGAVNNMDYDWVYIGTSEKCRCSWNTMLEAELYYDYQNKTGRFTNCTKTCQYAEA